MNVALVGYKNLTVECVCEVMGRLQASVSQIVVGGAKPPRHLAVIVLLTGMRRAIGLNCDTKNSFGMKKTLLLHHSSLRECFCKSNCPRSRLCGKRGTVLGSR